MVYPPPLVVIVKVALHCKKGTGHHVYSFKNWGKNASFDLFSDLPLKGGLASDREPGR